MRYQAVLVAAVLLAGCNPTQSTTNTQARLRNSPPSTCTQDQEKACPMDPVVACPDGSEPVLDYSSDCCTHFSCGAIFHLAVHDPRLNTAPGSVAFIAAYAALLGPTIYP